MSLHRIAIYTVLFAIAACGEKSEPAAEPVEEQVQVPAAEGGLFDGLDLASMATMFSQLDKPGLYDAPKESEDWSAHAPHMLTMSLSGAISEVAGGAWWGGESGIELRVLQERFAEFGRREVLQGVLLRVSDMAISYAAAAELRESLVSFKETGKFLHCHVESISNVSFAVLSACSTIGIAPTGGVVISGVAAAPVHLKGLLDNLGITADYLHVGDYKGAAEPLTLDKPSKATKETLGAILDQHYQSLVRSIAEGRRLPETTVKQLIDVSVFTSQQALAAKLVDREETYEAFRLSSAGDLPWKQVAAMEKKEPDMAELMKRVGLMPAYRNGSDHIALVYATGSIIDGAGDGILGARGQIASRTLVAALRALADADSVKAVVLRVDSGGGSALASELIWHAMEYLKSKKPVVVSMGNLAASGGYYISCGATRIFADADTLTGSIGVVGGKLALGGALAKVGVRSFPIGRGKRSTMWSALEPWNADERVAVQAMMESIYKVFVQRVADGRGKSYEEIHRIAQGRVWTGQAAVDNGLVDAVGGLQAAIRYTYLTVMGTVPDDVVGNLEIYPPQPTLMDWAKSFGGEVTAGPLASLAAANPWLANIDSLLGESTSKGLRSILQQLLSFRESRVQTTLLLPVLWQ